MYMYLALLSLKDHKYQLSCVYLQLPCLATLGSIAMAFFDVMFCPVLAFGMESHSTM